MIDSTTNTEADIEKQLNKFNLASPELLKFKKTVCYDESFKTDFICIEYADKLWISINSTGAIGTLLFVKSEKVIDGTGEVIYTVKNLLGQCEPNLDVFARSLAEKIDTTVNKDKTRKSLIVSIGLKKDKFSHLDLLKFYEKQIVESYSSAC